MNDVAQLVLVQACITKVSVKALNKSVLCWFVRLNKPKFYVMFKGPLAGKSRSLNGSYRRWIATKQCNAVQNTRELHACNHERGGNRQVLLREIIHSDQALNPVTA